MEERKETARFMYQCLCFYTPFSFLSFVLFCLGIRVYVTVCAYFPDAIKTLFAHQLWRLPPPSRQGPRQAATSYVAG